MGCFSGVLSTQSLDLPGYPFGSLVPYSLDQQNHPLLLLSHLAKHTRNLIAEPRCSLTLCEQGEKESQQLARLTCIGTATPATDLSDAAIERHFRYFPQSRVYYEQLNFHFFRLLPERYYWVGGFGAARWLGQERFSPPIQFPPESLTEFPQTLVVKSLPDQDKSPHGNLIAIDSEGIDLLMGDRLQRISFGKIINNINEIKSHLKLITA